MTAWKASREEKRVKVDEDDILQVVAKWTGIPLKRMEQGEAAAPAHHGRRNDQSGRRPDAKRSRRSAKRCAVRARI